MSGTGSIDVAGGVMAAAAIAALAGVVVVGGAVVATGKAASSAAKAAHNAAEQKQLRKMNAALGRYGSQLSSLAADGTAAIDRAAQQSQAELEAAVALLQAQFQREPDLSAFFAGCSAARAKMDAAVAAAEQSLQTQYRNAVAAELKTARAKMEAERRSLLDRLEQAKDDRALQQQLADREAAAVIARAEEMLAQLRADAKTASAAQAIQAHEQTLRSAKSQAEAGLGQAAAASAYEVMLSAATTLGDLLREDAEALALHSRCTQSAQALAGLMEQLRAFDYTFSETNSGEPITAHIDDFSVFFCGKWEQIAERVSEIAERLRSAEPEAFLAQELQSLSAELLQLTEQFTAELTAAYGRLYNGFARNELADTIAAAYAEMGFEEVPEQEDTGDPLNRTELVLVHAENGQTVRISLCPEVDCRGVVHTVISVADHTEDVTAPGVESRRAAQRSSAAEAIAQTPVARRNGILPTQSCTPGTGRKNAF